jgi:NSS family neurotransmitter:Na+ symporter
MGSFDLRAMPRHAWIIALGHAFFTLSIGQGTLVTYGSYLKPGEKILSNSLYIILADTLVSLLAAFCILSIVFSANMEIEFGPGLVFETLPTIFSQIRFGQLFAPLFFFFVFIAALTSQVSALEPLISHLTTTKKQLGRKWAVAIVTVSSFAIGVPSALSTNLLKGYTIFSHTFLELMNFVTTSILIPLGGFAAVCLIGWRFGIRKTVAQLGISSFFLKIFFLLTVKYSAPILILVVFLHSLGLV